MNRSTDASKQNLTIEEKIALLTGADFFATRGVDRLSIPSLHLSDGPHGVRAQAEGQGDHLGLNASAEATCFPSGAAMGSSWNPELVAEIAQAIGAEALSYHIQVILGPAFNIKRSPLCGRCFEYFSEDPYLAGKLAASYIRSIQALGVGACPKHFAANSQEDLRMVTNSVADERTLREIYLTAFEIAVKEGNPWSIMCAYNRINGSFCSENSWLLDQVLRKEWGFDGAVVSDWGAVSNRAKAAKAGLDLEMPGTGPFSDTYLKKALEDGTLTEEELDRCVQRVLTLIHRTSRPTKAEPIDFEGHHALARKAAGECLVLLKNEGSLLPIADGKSVAIIGALAEHPRYQGGGSSHVASWKVDQPLTCLQAAMPHAVINYAPGYHLEDGNQIDTALLEQAASAAKQADLALVFIGLTEQFESEGSDRESLALPPAHNELVHKIAAVNSNVVVVLTAGAPVELPWINQVKGLLVTYTAGDGLGGAVADVLTGAVNPSGKLAETWPLRLEHTPAYLNFRESKQDIRYAEGVFVGYRWYEKRAIPTAFPFGFGLSYTTFTYSDLTLSASSIHEDEPLTVTLKVTNSGNLAGKEVVQLYVSPEHTSIPRPVQELKGFAKISLAPGESKEVSFSLGRRAFAFYDEAAGNWSVEGGRFQIRIGASSQDIRLMDSVMVQAKPWHPLIHVTQETTYGELVQNPSTYPLVCQYLSQSPMYRPAEMPDAGDFLKNLPLWTLNHMSGHTITPDDLETMIQQLNAALQAK